MTLFGFVLQSYHKIKRGVIKIRAFYIKNVVMPEF